MYRAYGQRVTVQRGPFRQPLACEVAVAQFGPLQVSRHLIAEGLMVRIDRDDLYGAGYSSRGGVAVEKHAGQFLTSQVCAVTTDPRSGPMVIRPGPGSRMDCVVIEQAALEERLTELLGFPVRAGVPLADGIDLETGGGRSLMQLVRLFTDHVRDPGSVIFRPVVAEPLRQALLDAFLFTAGHSYREQLSEPVTERFVRRPVRLAMEAIDAHPEAVHTTTSLARLSGVSIRTLQAGFRRHLNRTPMTYLRQVRLTHAHDDLVTGAATSVAEAGHRWGFTHLGRFAADYRAKYGVAPSTTLREGLRKNH